MTKKYTVAVGMSGGVDSSVAALLLKKQGYNVFGLFMKNWEESEASHNCLAAKDQEDALSVCKALDIPLYTVNFTEDYYEQVFQDLLKGLQLGLTPNPDILCNREIKFNLLLKKAQNLGADYLATGHYCRISSTDSSHYLLKGLDPNKDQSYFIY
ncbi:MAG: tRNA-specific 2-thiouridylase, partial [Chlamydiae bacterium]|nr:tRNA-specific 2-thiouridylase [Chlamydiota bacterium]